jgi:hypothetical protein
MKTMSTQHIIDLLIGERDRIQAAITALQGLPEPVRDDAPEALVSESKGAPTAKKRGISVAGRKRIAEAAKARWAAIRAVKAETVAPSKNADSKPKISAAIKRTATPAPSGRDEAYRKMMSEGMKAAWAKRKKATKKNT